MTTALFDTFTDTPGTNLTAHTMNVGPGWTVYQGTFIIGTNSVATATNNDDDRFVSNAGQSDVTLASDCVCSYTNSGNVSTADIFFRVVDANNGWLLQNFAPSNQFFLYELDSSSYYLRTSASTSTQTSGTAATVGLILNGTSIAASLNGTAALSYSSSSFQTATNFGGRVSKNGSPLGFATWDNYLVTYTGGTSGFFARYYYDMSVGH